MTASDGVAASAKPLPLPWLTASIALFFETLAFSTSSIANRIAD